MEWVWHCEGVDVERVKMLVGMVAYTVAPRTIAC